MSDSVSVFPSIPLIDSASTQDFNKGFVDNLLYDFCQSSDTQSVLTVDSFSFFSQGMHNIVIQPKQEMPFAWFFVFTCLVLLCVSALKLLLGSKSFIRMDYFIKRKNSFTGFGFVMFWILVYICIFIVGTLLVCYSLQLKFSIALSFHLFVQIFVFTAFYFFAHSIVVYTSGFLFSFSSEVIQYEDINNYFRFLASILILPFLFAAYCYPTIYWLVPIVFILMGLYLFKWTQAWRIFQKKMLWHEFFLYLCSVEILPLAVIVKFVINRFLIK